MTTDRIIFTLDIDGAVVRKTTNPVLPWVFSHPLIAPEGNEVQAKNLHHLNRTVQNRINGMLSDSERVMSSAFNLAAAGIVED